MLLVLGFVLALVYVFFHYLKKLSTPRETGLEVIRLLESKTLSGNKQVHLVEVGEHIVLVGTADNSIQLLLELADKETLDRVRLKVSEMPTRRPVKNFADMVRHYLQKKPGTGEKYQSEEEALNFIRRQKERLNKLP
ncbi:MAG TPA: flagellar biosynthetic protein FliO [Spirochaetales bacterium]|nr:flagellar biosynthetic protein FliO [Spirochaetales bacterium]